MVNTFEQIFAADPSSPGNVASNGVVTIFTPGDTTKTPLPLTTVNGLTLPNPIKVNDQGFGPAFIAPIDRVAWEGGGFTGFLTSYDGMKEEAVAARAAADKAAAAAEKPADEAVEQGIARADLPGVVARAVAAQPVVTAAAAAAVDANPKIARLDSELEMRPRVNDQQIPQRVSAPASEDYTHAWADISGRIGFGLRKSGGEGSLPGGLDTPRAGTSVDAPYAWALADKNGRVSELAIGRDGRIPDQTIASWASRMGVGGGSGVAATRIAGVALTLADSAVPSTAYTNVSVRLPVKIGARANRWRVHVRNYNDKAATSYAGALSFAGISMGAHRRGTNAELTGQFEAGPKQIAGAFQTPADGAEWVSEWVESYPLDPGREYLLSYGFTAAAGQTTYMASAGGWTTTNATDVNAVAPTVAQVRSVPLDIWLEVEIPATTRVIAYVGDSLTLGIASTLPVYDSWAAKHAVANGAIHSVYAIGGSQFPDWADPGARRIAKWSGMSKPDATMIALGNNDIFLGSDLATMKARLMNGVVTARSMLSENIYLATVLPRIGANAGYEQVRKDFNEWMLTTLPGGARMVFDFASVIEADNRTDASLRWASSPTNFHLSSAGYARCAATITQRLA